MEQIRGKERPGGPSHITPPQPFYLKAMAVASKLGLRLPLHGISPHVASKLVQLRLFYLRLKIEGPLKKKIEEIGPECADNIVKFVARMRHVTVDEAAAIHEQICKSLLEESQQKAILEAIDKKVNTTSGSPNKTELRYSEHYQSKVGWDVYTHEVSVETRLMAATRRLWVLGGERFPEPTFAEAAMIALSCAGQVWSETQALTHTRRLQALYDQIPRELYPEQGPCRYLAGLEELNDEFPALWKQIIKDGEPVPPKARPGNECDDQGDGRVSKIEAMQTRLGHGFVEALALPGPRFRPNPTATIPSASTSTAAIGVAVVWPAGFRL